jgi:hypothetical protein
VIEFQGWPKIARLFRDIVITEMIDGTNSAVGIEVVPLGSWIGGAFPAQYAGLHFDENGKPDGGSWAVYAQSRSRVITPAADNQGFAGWVYDHAQALVGALGPGLHFGEWWGSGINRGYGLPKGEKRFSLFNTSRWTWDTILNDPAYTNIPELGVVPVLYQGEFSTLAVLATMEALRLGGSAAAPQFMNPEGVVVFHTASNSMYKATLENDEVPKQVFKQKRRANAIEISQLFDVHPKLIGLAA